MLFEPGLYFGRLQTVQAAAIGKDNTPCIVMTFLMTDRVLDPNSPNETTPLHDPEEKEVVWWLSERALEGTRRKLGEHGWNNDLATPRMAETLYADGCVLKCRHDTYEGKTRDTFDFPGRPDFKEIDPNTLRLLQAKLRPSKAPAPGHPPGHVKSERDVLYDELVALKVQKGATNEQMSALIQENFGVPSSTSLGVGQLRQLINLIKEPASAPKPTPSPASEDEGECPF